MNRGKDRLRGQRAVGAALSLGLVLVIALGGLESVASAQGDGLDSNASIEAARPYQAGPLEARGAASVDVLPSLAEEGVALAALIAVVLGFRLSGLARNSVRRRRLPPFPS